MKGDLDREAKRLAALYPLAGTEGDQTVHQLAWAVLAYPNHSAALAVLVALILTARTGGHAAATCFAWSCMRQVERGLPNLD